MFGYFTRESRTGNGKIPYWSCIDPPPTAFHSPPGRLDCLLGPCSPASHPHCSPTSLPPCSLLSFSSALLLPAPCSLLSFSSALLLSAPCGPWSWRLHVTHDTTPPLPLSVGGAWVAFRLLPRRGLAAEAPSPPLESPLRRMASIRLLGVRGGGERPLRLLLLLLLLLFA